jgi:hypothetical protein
MPDSQIAYAASWFSDYFSAIHGSCPEPVFDQRLVYIKSFLTDLIMVQSLQHTP